MEVDRLLAALGSFRSGALGIRDWSIVVGESRGLALGIKDCEVGNAHAPLTMQESCEAQYRVIWDDGRISRGNLERRQLQGDPAEALHYARTAAYDDPDADSVCGPAPMPEVETYDPLCAALARGETATFADRLERVQSQIREREFSTWSGSFAAGEGTSRVITSAGLDVTTHATTTSWHVAVNGEAGDGFAARRPEPEDDFAARLERLLETAKKLENPGPPLVGGPRRVILAPQVVEAYVLGAVLGNLGGAAVAHGEGHFRREQFGSEHPVLREDLRLRLDPLQPLRRGTYRCTSEGVPAGRCVYIERGRLVQPLLDLKYARRLGLEPTPLPMALDTLFLEGPLPLPFPDALEAAGGGVLVLSVLGVHTQDEVSGDFSLAAPQALSIEADALVGRQRGTISGNLFDVLSSDDLRLVSFEGEHTPGLLFTCRFDPQ